MAQILSGAIARRSSWRAISLLGTALGSTMVAGSAHAQNVTSTGTTDYTLTETGTRSGGPRTVDITTSGGNITLDLGTVNSANNGNTQGTAIAANNTGPGTVSIRDANATANGTGLSYAVDARATTGAISITNTGTVNASGNNADRAIYAASAGGDITITSNEANGQQRGISVNPNPAGAGTFGTTGTTTINATTTTANGTGQINAILGQGNRVVITSGTASNTNTAGVQGTAIFANAGAGGVLVNAGTTSALGQNQAAMQIFSQGSVDVTSGTVRTTQNSDGISIASGTAVVVRSTTVANEGANGGYGIVLGANRGGGGFNSDANGFNYTSASVTSGTVSVAGTNAFGIYATPNGAGTTTITSGTLTATGTGSVGIYVSPIGTGTSSGAISITSDMLTATNAGSAFTTAGIVVGNANNSYANNTRVNTGAVTIVSNKLTSSGIGIDAGGAQATVTSTDLTSVNGGILAQGSGSKTITSGAIRNTGSMAINAQSLDGGAVAVKSTAITGTGTGISAGNGAVNVPGGTVTVDSGSIALSTTATNNVNSLSGLGISAVAGGNTATALKITSGSIVYTGTGNTLGISAQQTSSGGGTLDITSGTVTTTGNGGYGILGFSTGAAVTINSTGNVTTVGTTRAAGGQTTPDAQRYADGIDALSQAGTIAVTNGGTISTAGATARGINAETGRAQTTFAAATTVASTAALTITNNGTVKTTGNTANAINVQNDSGLATINSNVVNTAGLNSVGINATSIGGAVAVTSANVATTGDGAGGIVVRAGSGAATIANTGSITTAGVGANGINAIVTTGAATITGAGTISTSGANAAGILVGPNTATAGTGPVSITAGPIVTTGANAAGISVQNVAGPITINARDTRTGNAAAIIVQQANGATAPIVVQAGIVRSGTTSAAINISSNGTTGPVTVGVIDSVTVGGAIDARSVGAVSLTGGTVQTTGGSATGLTAISSGAGATVASMALTSASIGIFAQGATGANVTSGTLAQTGVGNAFGLIAQVATPAAGSTIVPTGVTVNSTTLTSVGGGIRTSSLTGNTTLNSGSVTTSGTNLAGIFAASTTGNIALTSGSLNASGASGNGISANTTTGNIVINSTSAVTTGAYLASTGNSPDAITAFTSTNGTGTILINSGTASATGDIASGVFASGGGSVTINSGTVTTSGASGVALGANSRSGDTVVNATSTTATGANAPAVSVSATAGNVTLTVGTATSATGQALAATAGKLAAITATTVSGGGNGNSGVFAQGGTGVTLNVGSASSNGTLTTTSNANTGAVTTRRADAINATALTGTIIANIGSATATGAGADAVRLIANGTGGAVTANITGALASISGTGLFIDPPGAVIIDVAAGASITGGLNGINTVGATNTITNRGTISSTGGAGIVAAGATTLSNSGAIGGANNVAVQLGASNDIVTLLTGSAVTGRIVGGGGTDAAILSGTGTVTSPTQTVAGFTGFDTLTVQNGYWTAIAGNGSAFGTSVTTNAGSTLEVANGATGLALTAPSIIDNGTLVVRSGTASAGSTFGTSVVTGSGTVLFTGTGTATLTGTNTIQTTGTTTIDGGSTVLVTGAQNGSFVTGLTGTLQIGGGGTAGSFTGSLVDNGTLIVNRSDAYTFAGPLTGAGNIVKQGAGQLVFGSGYAFTGVTTIQGGSVRLTTPVASNTELDIEGAGQLDLSGTTQRVAELAGASAAASVNIGGGSLTVVQNTNTVFAGSIVGAGTFTKSGTGLLNFTGVNTYAGPTTINGGTLAVNGSIVSPVAVAAGGTLGGTGSVGSVTIGSGGTYAPGNSIGTQTVNGNVTFAAGSVFAVEANAAGQADRVNATGTATLQGGTVAVAPVAGTYANLTNYTILSAAGGVTGTFAAATSSDSTLSPFLAYSGNTVTLTLARNNVVFSGMGSTGNQVAVGGAITALGVNSPLYRGLLPLAAAAMPAALTQLSGELYASLPAALADSSKQVREATLARATLPGDGIGLWATGSRTLAQSRNQFGLQAVNSDRWAAIGGVDFSLAGLRVGIDGGYIEDKTRLQQIGSTSQTDTYLVGGHVGYARGPVSIILGGDYARHEITTNRPIGIAGVAALSGSVGAQTHAHTIQGYGEVGYGVSMGDFNVIPFARFSYVHIFSDPLTESGGLGALYVAENERNYKFGTLGARMSGQAPISNGVTFVPRATVSYTRGWDTGGSRTLVFANTAPQFTVAGTALARDAFDVNAGFDVSFRNRVTVGVGGFGSTSREWSEYGAKATVGLKF